MQLTSQLKQLNTKCLIICDVLLISRACFVCFMKYSLSQANKNLEQFGLFYHTNTVCQLKMSTNLET